jgi:dihydrofolate reductase
MITLIAAVSKDWSVGDANKMLWNIPSELLLFKRRTTDSIVVMGRRTFESMGKKYLPNRTNIVIGTGYFDIESAKYDIDGYLSNSRQIFIIGGAGIWAEFLPIATNAYITHIETDLSGSIKFPKDEFLTRFEPCYETINLKKSSMELDYKVVEYYSPQSKYNINRGY